LSQHQRIFNVPTVVVWLLAGFVAVHVVRRLLPLGQEQWWLAALAFIPARLSNPAVFPGGGIAAVTSFVTHLFVHGDVTHLLINSAWLLAFGSPVARRTDVVRFLAFFLLCGVAGALCFYLLNGPLPMLVVGASGAISGLMGAAFRFLFANEPGAARFGETAPITPLADTLRDRRVLMAVGAWTLINIVLAYGAGGLIADAAGIAWEAHLGGFYMGLLTYGFFDRQSFMNDVANKDAADAS
jgi:membrane associated rhomboid family serine protease